MSYLQVMVSERPRGEPSAIGRQVSELYCETPRPDLAGQFDCGCVHLSITRSLFWQSIKACKETLIATELDCHLRRLRMRCKASKRRFYLTVYVEVPLVFFDLPAILQNDDKRGLARSGAIALASPPAIQFRAGTGKAISIRPPFLSTEAFLRSHAMTVAYLPVRGIPLRAISRFATAPSSIYSSIRVSHDQNAKQPTPASSLYKRNGPSSLIQGRNYASGPPKSIPGRPKAHTGRSPPSKRRTASASTTTIAKPAPKATTRATGTKKPASRPRATRKAKPKAKAKPKPKKKELTEAQVERKKKADALVKRRTLREAALLTPKTSPPKQLPSTAFQVLLVERSGKGVGIIENSKAISASYKTLAPEAREVCLLTIFLSNIALTLPSAQTTSPMRTRPRMRLLTRDGSQLTHPCRSRKLTALVCH